MLGGVCWCAILHSHGPNTVAAAYCCCLLLLPPACPPETRWVVVTNGDNDYDPHFMSVLAQQREAEAVAFDYYSRYQRPTGRFQSPGFMPLASVARRQPSLSATNCFGAQDVAKRLQLLYVNQQYMLACSSWPRRQECCLTNPSVRCLQPLPVSALLLVRAYPPARPMR